MTSIKALRRAPAHVVPELIRDFEICADPNPLGGPIETPPQDMDPPEHMPHRLLLMRMEIRIFLEEWLARVPEFRLADGHVPRVKSTPLFGVEELQLVS